MTEVYNYTKGTEFAARAPGRRAFDVTPSSSKLPLATRAVMVDVECTITGIFVGESTSHTTHPLSPGVMCPPAFSVISAVSNSGVVKGYA